MDAYKTEQRDGMVIDWDVPIVMDDGIELRADVFRPIAPGEYPTLMCHGPYAKGLSFQEGYPWAWKSLARDHPDAVEGSSNKYQAWSAVDPERWVPDGYVCVRVDARGTGRSPGRIDCFSPRETQDFYDCIEWAAAQPWSNGKVGLAGVFYHAMNQWQVAALRPPHLAAICPFEGASDMYRDAVRHGGILSTYWSRWYPVHMAAVQHGVGTRGRSNPNTDEPIAGPDTVQPELLAQRLADMPHEHREHAMDDRYFRERSARLADIQVPLLSCGNWGGAGMHLRGNVEGFLQAASPHKWLEMHGLEHWTEFYTSYGRKLQKRFFDHFLKDEKNGWDKRPPLILRVRNADETFVQRAEYEWPLARTHWTRLHLDPVSRTLRGEPRQRVADASFRARSEELTFWGDPLPERTEITGPLACKLSISSTTIDADLFVTLRAYGPNGREVLFTGAHDPNVPLAQGWLRASHRKTDPMKSKPYRPWHTHDEAIPLVPGEVHEVEVEIWPTCVVLPAGYRLALTVQGRDYNHGLPGPMPASYGGVIMRGCGLNVHDDAHERDDDIFAGTTTLHSGPDYPCYLLVPVVPLIGGGL